MAASPVPKLLMCFLMATAPVTGLVLQVPLPNCSRGERLALDAITYYITGGPNHVYQGDSCHFVGKPGTLIKGGIARARMYGGDYPGITFGGTVRIQNVSIDGGINLSGVIDLESVDVGAVNIKDADVRWTGGGATYRMNNGGIVRSNVSLESFDLSVHPGRFDIDGSNVNFRKSHIDTSYECPAISKSTLNLVDSEFSCFPAMEGDAVIESSALNLTRSSMSVSTTSSTGDGGNFWIRNSTLHATCAGDVVMEFRDNGHIGPGGPQLKVINSAMYFANCSCQPKFPVSNGGVLNMTGGSMGIGPCSGLALDTLLV